MHKPSGKSLATGATATQVRTEEAVVSLSHALAELRDETAIAVGTLRGDIDEWRGDIDNAVLDATEKANRSKAIAEALADSQSVMGRNITNIDTWRDDAEAEFEDHKRRIELLEVESVRYTANAESNRIQCNKLCMVNALLIAAVVVAFVAGIIMGVIF